MIDIQIKKTIDEIVLIMKQNSYPDLNDLFHFIQQKAKEFNDPSLDFNFLLHCAIEIIEDENNESRKDLHIHSNNSDGSFTIEELIPMLRKEGIKTFSITDHDSIDSVKKVESIDLSDLEYIRGIEISARLNNYKVHILGYNYEITKELEALTEFIKMKRKNRVKTKIKGLKDQFGIVIKNEDYEQIMTSGDIVGSSHIIKVLKRYGYGSYDVINKNYIKKIYSGENHRVMAKSATEILVNAGGIPILAHPKEIEEDYGIDIEDIIYDVLEAGIEGIEIYNSRNTISDVLRYRDLAYKYNLLISGGSDFHGTIKPDVDLGYGTKEKDKIYDLSLVRKIRETNKIKKA